MVGVRLLGVGISNFTSLKRFSDRDVDPQFVSLLCSSIQNLETCGVCVLTALGCVGVQGFVAGVKSVCDHSSTTIKIEQGFVLACTPVITSKYWYVCDSTVHV